MIQHSLAARTWKLCIIFSQGLNEQSRTMKSKAKKRLIIVKRIRRVHVPRPLGTWKIAYADFVTALMAFFLLMWLIGAIKLEERKEISKYFQTPLMVVLTGGQSNDVTSDAIPGVYGEDKTKPDGQVNAGTPASLSEKDAKKLVDLQEIAQLQRLKNQLEYLIATNLQLKKFRNQIRIEMTTEGLRIQIIDDQNRPMFEIGSAILQPYTAIILHEIGKTLNDVPNRISLSGHTDATPYQGGNIGYSNWELSTDRANASRRELIMGGMDAGKILRVVGLSSSVRFNPADPYDPGNRRISIIVMNRQTEDAITTELEPLKPLSR